MLMAAAAALGRLGRLRWDGWLACQPSETRHHPSTLIPWRQAGGRGPGLAVLAPAGPGVGQGPAGQCAVRLPVGARHPARGCVHSRGGALVRQPPGRLVLPPLAPGPHQTCGLRRAANLSTLHSCTPSRLLFRQAPLWPRQAWRCRCPWRSRLKPCCARPPGWATRGPPCSPCWAEPSC